MSSTTPYRLFAVLCGVSVLFWWSVLTATFALAAHDDAYTHILLIIPISITLIIVEWKKRAMPIKPAHTRGHGIARAGSAYRSRRIVLGKSRSFRRSHRSCDSNGGTGCLVDCFLYALFRGTCASPLRVSVAFFVLASSHAQLLR